MFMHHSNLLLIFYLIAYKNDINQPLLKYTGAEDSKLFKSINIPHNYEEPTVKIMPLIDVWHDMGLLKFTAQVKVWMFLGTKSLY